ncbi:hypothetical protein Tco_1125621 [Tanacetum coccineum]|uniref:Uncharacterized protein n=1 Tax=Tanacetum coccineum TaxID=301880 RepID=A0ABQ5J9J2_9ASTR
MPKPPSPFNELSKESSPIAPSKQASPQPYPPPLIDPYVDVVLQANQNRYFSYSPNDWLKFNNREFSQDSRKKFRANHNTLLKKDIDGPEALDFAEFGTMHEGRSLQDLDQFCHVSYRHKDRTFNSQAWNRLFRIQEPVIQEYVLEFLSIFKFRDHVVELDIVDIMVFQLGEHNAKEKVTLEDLFFLHSMDRGDIINVPWNVAKFLSNKAKGTKNKSMIVGAHLIGRIARFNGLGQRELVDDMLDDSEDKAVAAEARRAQDEEGGVRRHTYTSFTNRLRVMDDRLGDIDSNIYTLSNEVEDLTAVISDV